MKIPPDTRDIRTCRRCFHTIRLVALVSGARLAVNPDPVPGGRVVAYYDAGKGLFTDAWFAGTAILLEFNENAALFRPHSDTCTRRRSK